MSDDHILDDGFAIEIEKGEGKGMNKAQKLAIAPAVVSAIIRTATRGAAVVDAHAPLSDPLTSHVVRYTTLGEKLKEFAKNAGVPLHVRPERPSKAPRSPFVHSGAQPRKQKVRDSKGSAFESRGSFFVRVTVAPQERMCELAPWATSIGEARDRAEVIQTLVNRLRVAGATDGISDLVSVGSRAGADELLSLARAVDGLVGAEVFTADSASANAPSFRVVADKWRSGELHRLYPSDVRKKKSVRDDGYRLDVLYDTGIADVPVARFTIGHAEHAMRELDAVRAKRSEREVKPLDDGSRRQYAQLLYRVLGLSVYPMRLIAVSPLPARWCTRVAP